MSKSDKIFRALSLTPPDKLKVCIIGQDPYHGKGQANGLAFSVEPDMPIPPSLRNIYREMSHNTGTLAPENGDLTYLAEQGVLLLNTYLTVYEGSPLSCANWGWDTITTEIIKAAVELPQHIVFMLWGRHAHSFLNIVMQRAAIKKSDMLYVQPKIKKDIILTSHPSPLSAYKKCNGAPAFIGSGQFSVTSQLLGPINWAGGKSCV